MPTRRNIILICLFAVGGFLVAPNPACAQVAAPAAQGAPVLDTMSSWRMFHVLKPPVVQTVKGFEPHLTGPAWLDKETAPAPDKWYQPAFDDSAWTRGTALRSCITPFLEHLCIRGRFRVSDPAAVKGLRLSVGYQGGAIIYLNGQEIGRGDIPAPGSSGSDKGAAYANPYSPEAYLDESGSLLAEDGTYIGQGRRAGAPSREDRRRIGLRGRSIKDLAIPSNLLKNGVNVLAIDIVRAPYDKLLLEKDDQRGKRRYNAFDWATCQIKSIELTAAAAQGLVLNGERPQGIQVWNSDPMATDTDLDWGDPCETLQPIELVTPRNGIFSGKVVVGSTRPLLNLKATVSDLKGAGGSIPAADLQIRYGLPGGEEVGTNRGGDAYKVPYAEWPNIFGLVADKAPAEVPVRKVNAPQRGGAVMPIWVTVRVPKDAKAGDYTATLTIQTQGEPAMPVPVRVSVPDWTLPEPQDYRTWVDLIEVPDTLSVEYNLPLWSEKHLAMIGRAFDEMSDSGSRTVYISAIAHTNLGNSESMIRWIKKAGGAGGGEEYQWDFSIMDKYLDLAEKHLGIPKIICLQVWEIYMSSRESAGARLAEMGLGSAPQITLLDPATGKTELGLAPKLTEPASKAIWTALLTQVRDHLKKRGLEKTLMLGLVTDAVPTKHDVQFFKDIAPDLVWVQQGHGLYEKNQKLQGITDLGYQATVWGAKFSDGVETHGTTDKNRMQGWKRNILAVDFERNTSEDSFPLSRWKLFGETNITGGQRGMGRIGADYWRALRDRAGHRGGWVHNRYPEGAWGTSGNMNLNLCNPVLGPGPDGPEATTRLLAMDEGVEECEARIVIESALDNPAQKGRLGPELVKRCERLLDERDVCMWKGVSNLILAGQSWGATAWRWEPGVNGHVWFIGSGWQERNRQLFALAGEVTRKLGEK